MFSPGAVATLTLTVKVAPWVTGPAGPAREMTAAGRAEGSKRSTVNSKYGLKITSLIWISCLVAFHSTRQELGYRCEVKDVDGAILIVVGTRVEVLLAKSFSPGVADNGDIGAVDEVVPIEVAWARGWVEGDDGGEGRNAAEGGGESGGIDCTD